MGEKKSKNHSRLPVCEAMREHLDRKILSFEVPGHRQGRGLPELADFLGENAVSMDFNSMRQLDNISNPVSVIREAEELMADIYGADHGFFLVNGTTSGVQGMVMAACRPGDKIIVPRDSHKSVLNAIIVSGAVPVYVQPEIDSGYGLVIGVSTQEYLRVIEDNPDALAVLVTYPGYYGFAAELGTISEAAHKKGMAVLADCAHGAHLGFSESLIPSPVSLGADLTAVSLHKTGGSLTQSSVLLVQGNTVSRDYVRSVLNLTQTTSGSYLLLASLDLARKNLAFNGRKVTEKMLDMSRDFRRRVNSLGGFRCFGTDVAEKNGNVFYFDETKLGINLCKKGITGLRAYDILRDEYGIQLEFGDIYNILGITGLGDNAETMEKFYLALKDFGERYVSDELKAAEYPAYFPERKISPRDAFYSSKHFVPLEKSEGMVSGESVMMYPPGIPIVAPGEIITGDVIRYIEYLKNSNAMLTDMEDLKAEYIKVVSD